MTQDVIKAGEAYTPDPVDFTRDRVPLFSGDSGEIKQKYMVYRVFDFGKGDAAGLAHVNIKTINKWRKEDQEFREFEDVKLPELRQNIQTQATLSQFYRNMWLFLGIDFKIVSKATVEGLESLTPAELDYMNRIRARYSMEALVNMLRVASGDVGNGHANMNVFVDKVFIGNPRGNDGQG